MSKHLKEIKEKIARGELKLALEQLRTIAENTPLLNDVILHSSRLSDLSKKIHRGIINPEYETITTNQITIGVLSLIDEIEDAITSNQTVKEEFDKFTLSYEKLIEDESKMTLKQKKENFKCLINNKLSLLQQCEDESGRDPIKDQIKNHIDDLRQINESEIDHFKLNIGHVTFVNRQREIDQVEGSTGKTEYWLINAPAGYGKTELMKELSRRIDQDKTISFYIQINADDDRSIIFNKFLTALDLIDDKTPLEERNFGLILYQKLLQRYGTDLQTKCLSLFIDFDGKASKYFSLFQSEVIPFFWDSLRVSPHFTTNPEAFKVVYAGRNLSKHLLNPDHRRVVRSIPLSDFDLENIKCTVKNHRNMLTPTLTEISAFILFLTGGHPLGIAKALNVLDRFGLSHLRDEKDKVYDLINLIAESIEFESLSEDLSFEKGNNLVKGAWFFPMLQACSVFRLITLDILAEANFRSLVHEIELPQAVPMDKRLRNSLLWLPYGYANKFSLTDVLEDGIARRVLNISLRQKNPQKYRKCCEFAKENCLNRIAEGKKLPPSRWLIEYLFQSMQIHAIDIDDNQYRWQMRSAFYSESGDLDIGINAYISTLSTYERQNIEYEVEKIIDMIDRDEEFQFMVKYFFREDMIISETTWEEFKKNLIDKFHNNTSKIF
ncbi:MAG: hypothetical protein HUU34_04915 [Saprospiraceae bacterium]|jgi:hypothetical protein|nr:hypothetical protein [Saprospiraceae bacterium]